MRWDRVLFGEGGARIVVSVAAEKTNIWQKFLQETRLTHWLPLGQVSSDQTLSVKTVEGVPLLSLNVEQISDRWAKAIERQISDQP
ncbi:MAG: hypothetical protein HC876_16600 [Chloroflexaceae bacterium]|nr:hypothetical protein [Chloroflexaceae bacterium]